MRHRVETVSRMEDLMPLIREALTNGQSVRFYPRGTSMLPMLRQNIDSVMLSPIVGRLKKFDIILYQRDNGKYVLHRIVDAGNTYICMGDNQFTEERGLREDQMIAVVTSFYRGDTQISVTGFLYRWYCYVWHYSRPIRRLWRRVKNWILRHLKSWRCESE